MVWSEVSLLEKVMLNHGKNWEKKLAGSFQRSLRRKLVYGVWLFLRLVELPKTWMPTHPSRLVSAGKSSVQPPSYSKWIMFSISLICFLFEVTWVTSKSKGQQTEMCARISFKLGPPVWRDYHLFKFLFLFRLKLFGKLASPFIFPIIMLWKTTASETSSASWPRNMSVKFW